MYALLGICTSCWSQLKLWLLLSEPPPLSFPLRMWLEYCAYGPFLLLTGDFTSRDLLPFGFRSVSGTTYGWCKRGFSSGEALVPVMFLSSSFACTTAVVYVTRIFLVLPPLVVPDLNSPAADEWFTDAAVFVPPPYGYVLLLLPLCVALRKEGMYLEPELMRGLTLGRHAQMIPRQSSMWDMMVKSSVSTWFCRNISILDGDPSLYSGKGSNVARRNDEKKRSPVGFTECTSLSTEATLAALAAMTLYG